MKLQIGGRVVFVISPNEYEELLAVATKSDMHKHVCNIVCLLNDKLRAGEDHEALELMQDETACDVFAHLSDVAVEVVKVFILAGWTNSTVLLEEPHRRVTFTLVNEH